MMLCGVFVRCSVLEIVHVLAVFRGWVLQILPVLAILRGSVLEIVPVLAVLRGSILRILWILLVLPSLVGFDALDTACKHVGCFVLLIRLSAPSMPAVLYLYFQYPQYFRISCCY